MTIADTSPEQLIESAISTFACFDVPTEEYVYDRDDGGIEIAEGQIISMHAEAFGRVTLHNSVITEWYDCAEPKRKHSILILQDKTGVAVTLYPESSIVCKASEANDFTDSCALTPLDIQEMGNLLERIKAVKEGLDLKRASIAAEIRELFKNAEFSVEFGDEDDPEIISRETAEVFIRDLDSGMDIEMVLTKRNWTNSEVEDNDIQSLFGSDEYVYCRVDSDEEGTYAVLFDLTDLTLRIYDTETDKETNDVSYYEDNILALEMIVRTAAKRA